MKPVRFTRHARNRMRWYAVSQEAAVRSPDATTAGNGQRVNYWRRLDASFLRVTAVEEIESIVIITVTLRSRGP